MGDEEVQDEGTQGVTAEDAKNSNACGMCRAMGLGSCKGHGGGASGGGGGTDESSLDASSPTPENQPSHLKSVALSSYLDNTELWKESSEDDLFKLDNEAVLVKMSLDLGRNKLVIEPNPSLKPQDREALYDGIIKELKEFSKEKGRDDLASVYQKEGNTLTIQFPAEHKLFESFIERLMEKNLIPGPEIEKALKEAPASVQQADKEPGLDEGKSSLPRAFDIPSVNDGPAPPGAGDDG
jgi:hypothetical protein